MHMRHCGAFLSPPPANHKLDEALVLVDFDTGDLSDSVPPDLLSASETVTRSSSLNLQRRGKEHKLKGEGKLP